jgi:hypothetical protein
MMPGRNDYLEPYRRAVAEGGARFESLLWKNADAQAARFDAAIDMFPMAGVGLADLGAGLGDFAQRLDHRGVAPGRYVGVEGVRELADEGRRRLKDVSFPATMIEADFVAEERLFASLVADHGVGVLAFSGSLNTMAQADAEAVLARAWHSIDRTPGAGLVFNFLSDRHGGRRTEETGPARRYDTLGLLGWALERTPLTRFRQDYLGGHDATVAMTVC